MIETRWRSLVKSVIWRAAGVIILAALARAVTGDWAETTSITIAFHGIRVVLYYLHERAWNSIGWGKI